MPSHTAHDSIEQRSLQVGLVFSTEIRHAYGDIPPAQLGDRIGSLWGTTVDFDNQAFSLVQLYWDHGSFEDGLRYRSGTLTRAVTPANRVIVESR